MFVYRQHFCAMASLVIILSHFPRVSFLHQVADSGREERSAVAVTGPRVGGQGRLYRRHDPDPAVDGADFCIGFSNPTSAAWGG
jgi:hypothetical protein